jgi:integrase/recombinase XerD
VGQLRQRMTADLELAGYSDSTKKIYLIYAQQFAAHHDRSPAAMGAEEVRQFLLHLVIERGLSRSSLKQARAALRFLYCVTLRRPVEVDWIPVPRTPKRLPTIFSGTEVSSFLRAVRTPKYRTIFTTMYASGLRIAEACKLSIKGIDSKRMVLNIRGKGGKERLTVLSPRLLQILRQYWKAARPKGDWLFEGGMKAGHASPESARRAFHKALAAAGITRKLTPHSLRHSFATHLIDTGTDITRVQALLGHKDQRTTGIYAHTSVERIARIRSPLDLLGTPEADILG